MKFDNAKNSLQRNFLQSQTKFKKRKPTKKVAENLNMRNVTNNTRELYLLIFLHYKYCILIPVKVQKYDFSI